MFWLLEDGKRAPRSFPEEMCIKAKEQAQAVTSWSWWEPEGRLRGTSLAWEMGIVVVVDKDQCVGAQEAALEKLFHMWIEDKSVHRALPSTHKAWVPSVALCKLSMTTHTCSLPGHVKAEVRGPHETLS